MSDGALQSAMSFLQKALPWIGAAATGNVPALVGLAARQISDATGQPVPPDPESIATAVANATPEQLAAIKLKELEMKDHALQLGFENTEEMARIGLQEDTLSIDDVKDARRTNAQNPQLWAVAWGILLTFAVIMGSVLFGCFELLSGSIAIKDASVVAAIAGLVGAIVGYVAANAQTVINFLFGGSLGSRDTSHALSASVSQSLKQLGDAAK